MESIPDGSDVLIVLGEIDCREGLLVCVEKGRYETLEEGIDTVVRIFMRELAILMERKKLKRVRLHPVVPTLNQTRHIVEIFNAIYKHHAKVKLCFCCRVPLLGADLSTKGSSSQLCVDGFLRRFGGALEGAHQGLSQQVSAAIRVRLGWDAFASKIWKTAESVFVKEEREGLLFFWFVFFCGWLRLMKLRALNPRNSFATFARQPRSDEFFVLVAGDYGVVEYAVAAQQQPEKRRELGWSCFSFFFLRFFFLLCCFKTLAR